MILTSVTSLNPMMTVEIQSIIQHGKRDRLATAILRNLNSTEQGKATAEEQNKGLLHVVLVGDLVEVLEDDHVDEVLVDEEVQ